MVPGSYLDFEKPVIELEARIRDMRDFAQGENVELSREIKLLEKKLERLKKDTFSTLTRWQRVQLARHPMRPSTIDYIERITTDFISLHGDRGYGDDHALVGGTAIIGDRPVVVMGQQKGRTTKEKLSNNFGMMHPEGYRKAMRLMRMAEKSGRPVVILIDTPGAFPGIQAEERGQAEAIARNLRDMSLLPIPIVVTVIGEGASGGALGIGMGDKLLMMENAWYSVISPEGCAAILWPGEAAANAPKAAESLRVTADDLVEMGLVDQVVQEPLGGAHRDPDEAALFLKTAILDSLVQLSAFDLTTLITKRRAKYRNIGVFGDDGTF